MKTRMRRIMLALTLAFAMIWTMVPMQASAKNIPVQVQYQDQILELTDVDPADTVESIKEKIREKTGIPENQQQLFLGGNRFKDGTVLSDNHVFANDRDCKLFLTLPNPEMMTVENGSAPWIMDAQTHCLWFGNFRQSSDGNGGYNTEPIKWRVLQNANGKLFLFSDKNLYVMPFHPDQYVALYWDKSMVRSWLNGYGSSSNQAGKDYSNDNFKDEAFSSGEYSLLQDTELIVFNTTYGGRGETTTDKVFVLSMSDANNKNYGFPWYTSDAYDNRVPENTDYAKSVKNVHSWWLRSPGYYSSWGTYVGSNGEVVTQGTDLYYPEGIRPAVNINLAPVLFLSSPYIGTSEDAPGTQGPADDNQSPAGGQQGPADDTQGSADGNTASDGAAGAEGEGVLNEIRTTVDNEWRVTLRDDGSANAAGNGHRSFAVNKTTPKCTGLEVVYTGAATGDNEYLSVVIQDKDGTIKYYGRVKNCSSASGTAEIELENKLEADDKLFVFNEQYNGSKETGYASGLVEIKERPAGHDISAVNKREPSCTEPGTEACWKCDRCGKMYSDVELKNEIREPVVIGAKGHRWGDWNEIKAPTMTSAGEKQRICSACGAKEQAAIPKLTKEDAISEGAPEKEADKVITKHKSEKDPVGSVYALLKAKSVKQTKTSVTLTWSKIKGAKKYVVYGNKCGTKNKLKKLGSLKGTSRTYKKVLKKKVKKGTYYKFIVMAVDKKGKVISTSKIIHAATKGGKVGNDKAVKSAAKKSKVTLKKGKTFKLKAKPVPQSKKLKVRRHRGINYESDNTRIARVSSKGVITGKAKGTCYVYAYAQNGIPQKIKVTVK